MKFGKFENDNLIIFRPPLIADGKHISTNDPVLLLSYGWKEVIYSEPEERKGFYLVQSWSETDTQIIQTWSYEPISDEPDSEDYEEALSKLGVDNE